MQYYAEYFPTGEIDGVVYLPGESLNKMKGLFYPCSEDTTPDTHYVDMSGKAPTIKKREALNVNPIIKGLAVSLPGLPVGSRIEVENMEVIVDAELTSIEFEIPGSYSLGIYPPVKYVNESLEVTLG